MKTPETCIIAAMDENNGIGKDNKLPWYIPEDLKRLKELTTPHSVIMGRKTFESILQIAKGKKPLPGRHKYVVTRDETYSHPDIVIAHSLEEAYKKAMDYEYRGDRIAIIGGGQIFEQSINIVDRLYLTIIEGKFPTDTHFPDYKQFQTVLSEQRFQSNGYRYKFLDLTR